MHLPSLAPLARRLRLHGPHGSRAVRTAEEALLWRAILKQNEEKDKEMAEAAKAEAMEMAEAAKAEAMAMKADGSDELQMRVATAALAVVALAVGLLVQWLGQ